MRKRLKWIDGSAAWRAAFAGKTDKYAEYVGPGFYDLKTGEEWGGFAKPFDTGAAVVLGNEPIYSPMYIPDVPDHISTVSGRYIGSASQQRDEFKRTNTRPWDADEKQPLGYADRNFALSRGLKICDKTSAWLEDKARTTAAAAAGKGKAPKRHRTDPNKLSAKARNEIVATFEANGITD
jgi:hypothetical protein